MTHNTQAFPRRSQPAQDGEGFDAPPTLERSGSEHREGAVTSPLLRFLSPGNGGTEGGVKTIEEGLGEKVELPLVREDGWVFEKF